MKRAIAHLATPDGPTRVLVAIAYVHSIDPPATTGKVNDLLPMLGRRKVEIHSLDLEWEGLIRIEPGRPRSLVPLVCLVPWADPTYAQVSPVNAGPAVRRARQRVAGCRHPLTSRWGLLCFDCGETLAGIPTRL